MQEFLNACKVVGMAVWGAGRSAVKAPDTKFGSMNGMLDRCERASPRYHDY